MGVFRGRPFVRLYIIAKSSLDCRSIPLRCKYEVVFKLNWDSWHYQLFLLTRLEELFYAWAFKFYPRRLSPYISSHVQTSLWHVAASSLPVICCLKKIACYPTSRRTLCFHPSAHTHHPPGRITSLWRAHLLFHDTICFSPKLLLILTTLAGVCGFRIEWRGMAFSALLRLWYRFVSALKNFASHGEPSLQPPTLGSWECRKVRRHQHGRFALFPIDFIIL